jgi:transcriptional regulator with XRE-family HTH domain
MADVAYIGPGGRKRRPLLRTVLGGVLRRNRLEQGRTLAEVARAARVSTPYLSELERGRKEASSEVLAAVCEALRIDLSDVLTEAGLGLVADRVVLVRRESLPSAHEPERRAVERLETGRLSHRGPRARFGDAVLLAA